MTIGIEKVLRDLGIARDQEVIIPKTSEAVSLCEGINPGYLSYETCGGPRLVQRDIAYKKVYFS